MESRLFSPLSNFSDLLLDAVCLVDAGGSFVFVSAACERIFGYTPQEMVGRRVIEMVAPEDRERTLQAAREIMAGQAKVRFENRYLRKDGQLVHIMWSARWSEADQLRVAVARDITESKQNEAMQAALYAISEAAHQAEDMQTLYLRIHQIIGALLPAPGFSVALSDDSAERISFAYHASAADGAPAPAAQAAHLCRQVLHSGAPLLLTPESAAVPAWPAALHYWLGVPLASQHGSLGVLALHSGAGGARYGARDQELLQFVSTQVATAIQRKQLQTRLRHMAQHDELTLLPNRRLFYDRIEQALARVQRQAGRLALLFLDLNKFKQVNDLFGHAAGDLVLRTVARRLQQCVRDCDTVARMGGDEFVVLLEYGAAHDAAAAVAAKIVPAVGQPIKMGGGRWLRIVPSIGVAHYPDDGDDAQQLVRHADLAMYARKQEVAGAGLDHYCEDEAPGAV